MSAADLRAGRRTKPWTFREIADDLGVDRSTVHGWAVRGLIPWRWNPRGKYRREVLDSDYREWRATYVAEHGNPDT